MDTKQFTERQLAQSQTIKMKGVMLDSPFEDITILNPCLCVQDSPENPCPCDLPTKILIPSIDVMSRNKLEKKNLAGNEMMELVVNRNANLLVETATPVPAAMALQLLQAQSPVGLSPPFPPGPFPPPGPLPVPWPPTPWPPRPWPWPCPRFPF